MGFGKSSGQPVKSPSRFILPLSDCEEILETILEDLQPDPQELKPDERRLRCTGTALSVAIGLLGNSFPNSAARIMCFTGGPCTSGPGLIVTNSFKEFIRAHHDITNGQAKHLAKAKKVCVFPTPLSFFLRPPLLPLCPTTHPSPFLPPSITSLFLLLFASFSPFS